MISLVKDDGEGDVNVAPSVCNRFVNRELNEYAARAGDNRGKISARSREQIPSRSTSEQAKAERGDQSIASIHPSIHPSNHPSIQAVRCLEHFHSLVDVHFAILGYHTSSCPVPFSSMLLENRSNTQPINTSNPNVECMRDERSAYHVS